MIFQHPETKQKILTRYGSLLADKCKREGWVDITPARTQKQIEATKRWTASGSIARLQQNIRQVIRNERASLDPKQIEILNKTEIILQQLSKKYRKPQTPKK